MSEIRPPKKSKTFSMHGDFTELRTGRRGFHEVDLETGECKTYLYEVVDGKLTFILQPKTTFEDSTSPKRGSSDSTTPFGQE